MLVIPLCLLLSAAWAANLPQQPKRTFGFFDWDDDTNATSAEGDFRLGRIFGNWGQWLGIGRVFGIGPDCGPRDACPVHHCRFDPAVIHGYCCGCASPLEEFPFLCPQSTPCPMDTDRLCSEFNHKVFCCCPGGVIGQETTKKPKTKEV